MNNNVIIGIVGGASVIGAVAYSIYSQQKIDKSIEKLTGKVNVDVSDPYIVDAVDRAVERQTHKRIHDECEKAIDSIRSDIHKECKKTIKTAYSNVEKDVKAELSKQVGNVSIDDVKDKVIEEAREEAIKKLKADMDIILKDYNTNLENMSKIYANIAQTLEGANKKTGTTFTIG